MKNANLKYIKRPWREQTVSFAPYFAGLLILLILPLILQPYVQGIVTRIIIMAIFAIGMDIMMGYTGLMSLGHGAFFGIAGYVVGYIALQHGITNFWVALPLAIAITAAAAMVLGFLALRMSGIYFFLVTLATAQLLQNVAIKWRPVTGGEDGLTNIPRPDLGIHWDMWNATSYYYFAFIIFIICFFILYRVVNSPFGRALEGVRDNERRMRALGYNTWLYKYIAFIIAAIFAGVSGVLYTYLNGIVVPDQIGAQASIIPLIMVMIGGAGTLFGPVLGAVIIVLLEYYTSSYIPARWPLIEGIIFVLTAMYFRQGIGVHLRDFWKKVRSRYAGSER